MKVISTEAHGFKPITIWIEDDGYYKKLIVDNNNKIEILTRVATKKYDDYAHFAGVMGKFNPYTIFMKDPVTVKRLDFKELNDIANAFEKKRLKWIEREKEKDRLAEEKKKEKNGAIKTGRHESKRTPPMGPTCGSSRIANILYGMPDFDDKLEKDLDSGRITLGGCCITNDDPEWQCADCQTVIYKKRNHTETKIIEIFKNENVINAALEETKRYYRPYDPGSYLYHQIMEYNFDSKFSKKFIELAYVTLSAWNMNSRGAKLQNFEVFKKSIVNSEKTFNILNAYTLKDMDDQIVRVLLEKLFNNLDLVAEGKPPLVTFSKTMHFYLPNLIGPIDRTYTMKFFYNNTGVPSSITSQFKRFMDIQSEYCKIAKECKLSKYIDGVWNRSIPKIVDNMIIGYMRTKR